jgi:hypothetical protein
MRTDTPTYGRSSWFESDDVTTLYADFYSKEIHRSVNPKYPIPLFVYPHGHTLNYLPAYGYPSAFPYDDVDTILAALKSELEQQHGTAAFIPIQGVAGGGLHCELDKRNDYVQRLPSYCVDLTQPLTDLRRGVSRRRRSKLLPKEGDNVSFVDDKGELVEAFLRHYQSAMMRLSASGRFVFDEHCLRRLCALDSVDLIGVSLNGEVELVLLHGINEGHVDFVLSGASSKGQPLATFALWHSIERYIARGLTSFHLGGGITPGDGLDDFKRQFGGTQLFNGGVRLLLDADAYDAQCKLAAIIPADTPFFPAYLRSEVLGVQTK